MIYSITDEPTNPNVSEYISDKFDLIFEALLLQKVLKLSDTNLLVIVLVLRLENKTIDKHINGIINSIEQILKNKEEDQIEISNDTLRIFLIYSQIFYHLANFYDNDIKIIKIEQYFEKFYDILECLFNFGILNNDQLLIQTSGKALNQIIDISNRLGEIYEKTLDLLEQSRTQCLPKEIRFIVQSSYCSIISNMLLKLKKINIGNCIDIIKAYA